MTKFSRIALESASDFFIGALAISILSIPVIAVIALAWFCPQVWGIAFVVAVVVIALKLITAFGRSIRNAP